MTSPSEVTVSVYGPDSKTCKGCGGFLPQPPHLEVCRRCTGAAQKLDPVRAIDLLFLAAKAFESGRLQHETAEQWLRRMISAHFFRRQGPSPFGFSVTTPIKEMQEKVRELADEWKAGGCRVG